MAKGFGLLSSFGGPFGCAFLSAGGLGCRVTGCRADPGFLCMVRRSD